MERSSSRTPTGIQAQRDLRRRRLFLLVCNVFTYVLLCAAMSRIAAAGGWTVVDMAMFASFALAVPWSVLGFWNALVGSVELCLHGNRSQTAPFPAARRQRPSVATAVIMTVRNEDARRAFTRLRAVKRSLDKTGFGDAFQYCVLSDTDMAEVAACEAAEFDAWRTAEGEDGARLFYRRRADNVGYKGGNILDFCRGRGAGFEFMLLLDADSLMSGETILDLVGVAEANPRLGIVQTVAVGLPTRAPFARLFQFGMRQGLRIYMAGAAWWTGDCGSFWGHNALVRVAPLAAHCRLPVLPGRPPWGGHIMAHDQVEAVLMRRAGYEVRVLPLATGSFEDAPPDLITYTTRDLRWCQGNLQYWRLLAMPGLPPTSRFQLFWAAMMFYGMPAWNSVLLLIALRPLVGPFETPFPRGVAITLYVCLLLMGPMPKLAGYIGVAFAPAQARRFGGAACFLCGCASELAFSFAVKAITEFRVSLFMAGLAFGRSAAWSGQARDPGRLTWRAAAAVFWPATVFGLAVLTLFTAFAPALVLWSLPMTAGLALSIPLAVLTADPGLGGFFVRHRLCSTPEELDPPSEIRSLEDETVCRR